jgi:hypothetical protein
MKRKALAGQSRKCFTSNYDVKLGVGLLGCQVPGWGFVEQ